jgi:hypothetical protein
MQLDRDVQVCEKYLFVFLSTSCFEILLLPLENITRREISLNFGWMDGMFCLTPGVRVS